MANRYPISKQMWKSAIKLFFNNSICQYCKLDTAELLRLKEGQKFQTRLDQGPNTTVWEAASSSAHHTQKTNTINKPHDTPWCSTHGPLPRRGKECDVQCVLHRTWKIFLVSKMQHRAVYWVLFQALSSTFAFLRVYGTSLLKSVINSSFILLNFSYAYAPNENREHDSIHKTQELHHFVMIKELTYLLTYLLTYSLHEAESFLRS